ncbi:MAG: NAD(P)-binding protein [Gemmatimonadaceae bacterium]
MGVDGPPDRDLGLDRPITRRDFLNGLAIGVGALGALSPRELWRAGILDPQAAASYPPALTGLRGSTDASFENAHKLRDGASPNAWGIPRTTGERYDLIVVGGGISGLAAAHFYRQKVGPNARILILDNHDDFGGHARRNEFTVDGRLLIGYGGTQSIDTPSEYSPQAMQLLKDLGIDLSVFNRACDEGYFSRRGMSRAVFFDRETFGQDRLVRRPPGGAPKDWLAQSPLSETVRNDIARVYNDSVDYLKGKSKEEKLEHLARTSFRDYLVKDVGITPDAIPFFQTLTHDLYGVGVEAVPAGDCRGVGYPGFRGLGLGDQFGPGQGVTASRTHDDPYIYHFPDGNASIARLLVRELIPDVIDGRSMTDVVTAVARYAKLDRDSNRVRLRLNSTVVSARHAGSGTSGDVDVIYVQGNVSYAVRASACVLACWHGVIPHLCPDLPRSQREALVYGVKVPLLYTNVALHNWKAMDALKTESVYAPGSYFSGVHMDFPVSLGTYRFARGPDDPVILHVVKTPCKPGLPARDQQRAGRFELLSTPYATLERNVRDQLARTFGAGGFDPARDIAGITVNRWSHGYTYEYNSLYDPDWKPGESPCEIARQRYGNIAIANADAQAFAYTDAAIDQAYRAVRELTS